MLHSVPTKEVLLGQLADVRNILPHLPTCVRDAKQDFTSFFQDADVGTLSLNSCTARVFGSTVQWSLLSLSLSGDRYAGWSFGVGIVWTTAAIHSPYALLRLFALLTLSESSTMGCSIRTDHLHWRHIRHLALLPAPTRCRLLLQTTSRLIRALDYVLTYHRCPGPRSMSGDIDDERCRSCVVQTHGLKRSETMCKYMLCFDVQSSRGQTSKRWSRRYCKRRSPRQRTSSYVTLDEYRLLSLNHFFIDIGILKQDASEEDGDQRGECFDTWCSVPPLSALVRYGHVHVAQDDIARVRREKSALYSNFSSGSPPLVLVAGALYEDTLEVRNLSVWQR
ncbi:hypothetical protein K439DRAFT_1624335 [Ramaria rubella]|nr:hypothetical protein K439DRAFT_1624335 [Ramaria rubella]